MAAVGRDGLTNEKSKLTVAEKLMIVGMIACGTVGIFVPLVAVGAIIVSLLLG
jgi:hypothetical protein